MIQLPGLAHASAGFLSVPAPPRIFAAIGPEARHAMTPVRSERIRRQHRLTTDADFAAIKAGGLAFRGRHCLLLALARPGENTRVGFVASRKGVGNAVERNRARRRLREIVRRRWPRVSATGYRLMIVAYRSALTAPHQELASDLERLLASAGALAPVGLEGA